MFASRTPLPKPTIIHLIAVCFALFVLGGAVQAQSKRDVYELFELDASLAAKQRAYVLEGSRSLPHACSKDWLETDMKELVRLTKTEKTKAGYSARFRAATAAACALVAKEKNIRTFPTEDWAFMVGEALMIYATYNPVLSDPGAIDRAIGYFEYVRQTGDADMDEYITQMKKIKRTRLN